MKHTISEDPPSLSEHHVRLPEEAAQLLGAFELQAQGITGKGIKVAVIDSGFFPHPFYTARNYHVRHIPTYKQKHPQVDEYGHGTAQLASLFSIAPEAEVLAIKCMDRNPSYAFEKALELRPHVINCAWGFDIDYPDPLLAMTPLSSVFVRLSKLVLKAVDRGIVVVAAAGNGQHAFPGSMPEVLSAGGVFYGPDGKFEPSDVSSKFESTIFPGRMVPDVCGLVGNRPHGRLLLVPVPPRAKLARRPSFSTIAAGEANQVSSGWAMFSGTSAATSMVSGAAALLLQELPGLSPRQIKEALVKGAKPVYDNKGRCHSLRLDVEAALAVAIGFSRRGR
jgi:subtilisin family serine protease